MQERIGFEKDTGEMRRRAVQKGLSEPAFDRQYGTEVVPILQFSRTLRGL